jgi:hypothetical protein
MVTLVLVHFGAQWDPWRTSRNTDLNTVVKAMEPVQHRSSPELPIFGPDELGHRRPGCLCQLTEHRSQKYSREIR